jgi:hypothetical protein
MRMRRDMVPRLRLGIVDIAQSAISTGDLALRR